MEMTLRVSSVKSLDRGSHQTNNANIFMGQDHTTALLVFSSDLSLKLPVSYAIRNSNQWRIYIVKFWMRPPGPIFLIFMQLSGKVGQVIG